MPNIRNGSKGGFEPGLTWLRVGHSTGLQVRKIIKNASRPYRPSESIMWVLVQLPPCFAKINQPDSGPVVENN